MASVEPQDTTMSVSEVALLGGKGLAEVLRAPGEGVLVRAGVRHLGQAVGDRGGRVEVGESLREVDGVVAQRHTGHASDDGIGEFLGACAQRGHGASSGVTGGRDSGRGSVTRVPHMVHPVCRPTAFAFRSDLECL